MMGSRRFTVLDTERVDAVGATGTGRKFLIVGDDDEVQTVEAHAGDQSVSTRDNGGTATMTEGKVMFVTSGGDQFPNTTTTSTTNGIQFSPVTEELWDCSPCNILSRNQVCPSCGSDLDSPDTEPEATRSSLMAAAFPIKSVKKAWFEDPQFGNPDEDSRLVRDNATGQWGCPLTITDDGQVFGHVALWGSCHTGYSNECIQPPRSASGYSFFRTGCVKINGEDVPVGQITMGTGHSAVTDNAQQAAAHYDNTGTSVANVSAGEDSYGVWVAGSIRKGVTLEQVETLRASSPSGDWRRIGGSLEMVALLSVNVPGYPVPRSLAASAYGYDDSGDLITVIASGRQGIEPAMAEWINAMESRFESLEKTLKRLRPLAAERIRSKLSYAEPNEEVDDYEVGAEEEEDAERAAGGWKLDVLRGGWKLAISRLGGWKFDVIRGKVGRQEVAELTDEELCGQAATLFRGLAEAPGNAAYADGLSKAADTLDACATGDKASMKEFTDAVGSEIVDAEEAIERAGGWKLGPAKVQDVLVRGGWKFEPAKAITRGGWKFGPAKVDPSDIVDRGGWKLGPAKVDPDALVDRAEDDEPVDDPEGTETPPDEGSEDLFERGGWKFGPARIYVEKIARAFGAGPSEGTFVFPDGMPDDEEAPAEEDVEEAPVEDES